MLFNSIEFILFLPSVFILYWFFAKKRKQQNILILLSSYLFYGWWDWRFLSLILFSTIIDFFIGISLENNKNSSKRKMLLWSSILMNIGFLGFFKYYNFFIDNFISAFASIGIEMNVSSLNIILPVGISFYTFQTLSYTIDIYKKKVRSTSDFITFAAFVSFFPQLVAGPIERAANLLPQFKENRKFDYKKAVDGMKQILWGFFKKIVIADSCAEYANMIFNNSADYGGSTLIIGAIFFTFQIYGDFSGYSDIAIGTARLFGFNLMQNFAFPYFSRDIAEFWRRWHISLSTWFRDYLYIPLGGSKGNHYLKIRNVFIIFIVSGFWHGANWTFLFWGGLNALYFIPIMLRNKNRNNLDIVAKGRYLPTLNEFLAIALTFSLTVFAWIFFRAENISHAFDYIKTIFSETIFSVPEIKLNSELVILFILILTFIIIEWLGRESKYALESLSRKWKKQYKFVFYYLMVLIIIFFTGSNEEFIYFQF